MKTMIIALTILGLVAGMSSTDALAQSDDTSMLEGDIDIGVIYPLTGDLAERGTHRLAGAELGAADFNAYLESIGANWQIVLNVEDTETKPTASLEKAQLLNSKGIKFVIGPAGSGNVLSVKPYADQNNMLVLSCCSTSPTLAIPGDSVFRLAPDDNVQGLALARLIESEGIEALVPMWRQDDYGNNLAELVRSNFESRGVVDEGIPYDPNLADNSAAASLLAERVQAMADEHGADRVAVLIIGYDEVLNIVQSAANYEILEQVRWFAGESIAKESFILQDPIASRLADAVGLTAFQIFENRGDKFDRVTEHIVDEFGVDPATYVYQSYDAAWLIGLSILEAGTTDPIAVKEALPGVAAAYQGALGSTKLNDAGDLLPLDLAIWQVNGDEWTEQGKYSAQKSVIVPATQVDGDVTIGAVYPLTGDLSTRGLHRLASTELGISDFNEFVKSLGHEWQIIVDDEDSATNPEIARQKVQVLNSKGIKLIVGLPVSSNVKHLKQYVDQNDMLVLSCCSTSPSLSIPGDNVFRVAPDDATQGLALASIMRSDGIEALVSIWRNDDYGNGVAEHTHANFEKAGGVVGDGIAYDPNLPTISSDVSILADEIHKLVDAHGADKVAVLMVGFDESVDIIQSAARYGIMDEVRWFGAETYVGVSYFAEDRIANSFVNKVRFTALFVSDEGAAGGSHDRVIDHIQNEFGTTPASYVAQAYDAAWLMGLAILESGTTNSTAVKEALPRVASTYSGALASTEMNENGDLVPLDLAIWEVIDSDWVEQGKYSLATNSIIPKQ